MTKAKIGYVIIVRARDDVNSDIFSVGRYYSGKSQEESRGGGTVEGNGRSLSPAEVAENFTAN